MSLNSGTGGEAFETADVSALRTESINGSSIWPPACVTVGAQASQPQTGKPKTTERRRIVRDESNDRLRPIAFESSLQFPT